MLTESTDTSCRLHVPFFMNRDWVIMIQHFIENNTHAHFLMWPANLPMFLLRGGIRLLKR